MAITSSYLVAVGKLGELLNAIRNAQAPDRFTIKFLEDLGYKSTNDRLFIGLLKALGFLDQGGSPQQRYFDFLDDEQSGYVIADGMRDAYEDLFRVNTSAHEMSQQQVQKKLNSLTQGQYSDTVLKNMSRTFVELSKHADFAPQSSSQESSEPDADAEEPSDNIMNSAEAIPLVNSDEAERQTSKKRHGRLVDSLAYRIEIALPPTRDKAVYDAIFRSLKEHLL